MLLYYRKVMKVLAEERQQMILQMLKENKVVKLQEICEKSGCSESSAIVERTGHVGQGDTQYF